MRKDYIKGEFTVADYIDTGKYYPNMNAVEIAQVYNGMGAEWMSEEIREILDKVFHIFRDAVLIHDIDYAKGLTKEDKIEADKRFYKNMKRCIWHQISIWHPLVMFELYGIARLLYCAVRDFGAKAFWANKEYTR